MQRLSPLVSRPAPCRAPATAPPAFPVLLGDAVELSGRAAEKPSSEHLASRGRQLTLTVAVGAGLLGSLAGGVAQAQTPPPPVQAQVQVQNSTRQAQLSTLRQDYAHQPAVLRDLDSLEQSGRFFVPDDQGRTALDYVTAYRSSSPTLGIDKERATRELLAELAVPGRNSQNNHGTCAATTIQYLHATERPADYARVVTGLLSPSGRTSLANGTRFDRNATALPDDHSGRKLIDRIYQASMMDFANGPGAVYDNAGSGTSRHNNGKDMGDGLTNGEIRQALSAVLNERYDIARSHHTPLAPRVFQQHIERQLQDGKRLLVAMVWDENPGARDRSHAVAVERLEGDYVVLRNPWGAGDRGTNGGPPREVVDAETGMVRLHKADFYERLSYGIGATANSNLLFTLKHINSLPYTRAQPIDPQERWKTVVPVALAGAGALGAVGYGISLALKKRRLAQD